MFFFKLSPLQALVEHHLCFRIESNWHAKPAKYIFFSSFNTSRLTLKFKFFWIILQIAS